jgi:alkylation response protein AidB-like acyl-CoA dehydrogenase
VCAELLEDLRTTTRGALSVGTGDVIDELDLDGLLVDSDRGGLGLGDREMVLVATELGRALSPSAFLPTAVLAATLLASADTEAAAELLATLAVGGSRCAVAVSDTKRWASAEPTVAATPTPDDTWLLSGTAWAISTPSQPDTVLTIAAADDGAALFSVAADHVELTPADQLDPARGLVEVALSQALAWPLSGGDAAAGTIAEAYRRGLLAVGAE